MKLRRRNFLHLAAVGAAALPIAASIGLALGYPTRPVHIIVGFPPASGPDIVARLVGQRLSDRLGQQFIVEDRPRAGGSIATQAVVNASADGYTLLMATSANAINATLYPKPQFQLRPRRCADREHQPRALCHGCQFSCPGACSSSPTPRLTPTRSTWHLPVSGPRHNSATSCLR